jgi:hypothetical protein
VEERIMHTEFCLEILMERSYLDYTQTWESSVKEVMGKLLTSLLDASIHN